MLAIKLLLLLLLVFNHFRSKSVHKCYYKYKKFTLSTKYIEQR